VRFVVSFPVALLLLSAVTAGGIGLAFELGERPYAWVVLPVVGVLAAWFLVVYARRPGPESEPTDEEPFDDPVEEADELDTEESADGGADGPPPPSESPPAGPSPTSPIDEPLGPTPPDDAAFDDPVEEADRIGPTSPLLPMPDPGGSMPPGGPMP